MNWFLLWKWLKYDFAHVVEDWIFFRIMKGISTFWLLAKGSIFLERQSVVPTIRRHSWILRRHFTMCTCHFWVPFTFHWIWLFKILIVYNGHMSRSTNKCYTWFINPQESLKLAYLIYSHNLNILLESLVHYMPFNAFFFKASLKFFNMFLS